MGTSVFVCRSLANDGSGTPTVVRRLLQQLTVGEAVVIGRPPNRATRLPRDVIGVRQYKLPVPPNGARGHRAWMLGGAIPGVAVGLGVIRRTRATEIVVVFPDEGSLLTGYLLHRITGLPLVAWFCDLYQENRRGWESQLAAWLQPRVFGAASIVLAVNEGMAEFYRDRSTVRVEVLPTALASGVREVSPPGLARTDGRTFVLGYSGTVNDERVESLSLVASLVAEDPTLELRLFTGTGADYLSSHGIEGQRITRRFLAEGELLAALRECDVLLLPLTFDSKGSSRAQLATCFGIKAYEYMLSGRPILIHCPKEFFTARFFVDHECGLVVGSSDREALAHGIQRLRRDPALGARLAASAADAMTQFEGLRVANRFREIVRAVRAS
jgi:glycosyltransferase involved in cell wall biosynthesis